MSIEIKIRKRIKQQVDLTGEIPEKIEVTEEEYKALGEIDKFEGVKLKVK